MRLLVRLGVVLYLSLVLFLTANPITVEQAPQPQNTLKQMLKITWSKGPDLPQGFQDSQRRHHRRKAHHGGWLLRGAEERPGKAEQVSPRLSEESLGFGFVQAGCGLERPAGVTRRGSTGAVLLGGERKPVLLGRHQLHRPIHLQGWLPVVKASRPLGLGSLA